MRRKANQRRLAIIAELEALKLEFPERNDRSYIDDMILYAVMGRDRMRLPDDWAAKARARLAEHRHTFGWQR